MNPGTVDLKFIVRTFEKFVKLEKLVKNVIRVK